MVTFCPKRVNDPFSAAPSILYESQSVLFTLPFKMKILFACSMSSNLVRENDTITIEYVKDDEEETEPITLNLCCVLKGA